MIVRGSLRAKLGLALLLVAVVPTVTASAVVFGRQRAAIIEDRSARLTAIAAVQQARIEAWVAASNDSVALVASRTRFRRFLADLQEPPVSEVDRQFIVAGVTDILVDATEASTNLLAVHALDRSGQVVASSRPERVGADLSDQPYVLAAAPGSPSVSHAARVGEEIVGIHGGVVELDGEPLGWVVLEHHLQPLIDVLTDRSGLGATGEAVLARRDPWTGRVVTIGPLLDDPGAAMERLPIAAIDPATERAVRGVRSDAAVTTDYRDEEVVAATRSIDGTDWGLVVKQDRAEILDATNGLRNTLVAAAAIVTTLAIAAAWLLAHQLTRHIGNLTATARQVARGDRSARAEVGSRDELAELAVAFNRMTDDLVGHEEKLETRKTQLESFLYVSSHDLKTPLRSISSFGQLLRLDYGDALDERACHYLERIETGALRTIDVIDDLLTYVRVDHNDHESGVVDLTVAASAAREALAAAIAEKGALVTIGELGCVEGNERLLVQLFQNLVGNALKFGRDGIAPVVEVTRHAPSSNGGPQAAPIVVADNGVGVPTEARTRILAPFERLHSADEVPGTGLGLAVCERIVSLHDGSIAFVDSPLGGAAVEVRLAGASRRSVSPSAMGGGKRSGSA